MHHQVVYEHRHAIVRATHVESSLRPYKCVQAIVDIATLTGACIIALGGEVAGLFTPSDAMAAGLSAASNAAGEKLWRMPMEPSYAEQLKSSVADMKNTGEQVLCGCEYTLL
jgi:leucyl aminopeptidase